MLPPILVIPLSDLPIHVDELDLSRTQLSVLIQPYLGDDAPHIRLETLLLQVNGLRLETRQRDRVHTHIQRQVKSNMPVSVKDDNGQTRQPVGAVPDNAHSVTDETLGYFLNPI